MRQLLFKRKAVEEEQASNAIAGSNRVEGRTWPERDTAQREERKRCHAGLEENKEESNDGGEREARVQGPSEPVQAGAESANSTERPR